MVKVHDSEGATIVLRVTRGARGSGFARECATDGENSRVYCVLSISYKRPETRILAGISFCGSGKRLSTHWGERAVLSGASRRALQQNQRRALVGKGGALSKGNEPETPRAVSLKGEGRSRISNKSSKTSSADRV